MMAISLLAIVFIVSFYFMRKQGLSSPVLVDITCILSGIFLAATLVVWPIFYYSIQASLYQYEAAKESIDNARKSKELDPLERAAIQNKIIDTNMLLASIQYWNKGIWDIYIPDEVMELKPLQ